MKRNYPDQSSVQPDDAFHFYGVQFSEIIAKDSSNISGRNKPCYLSPDLKRNYMCLCQESGHYMQKCLLKNSFIICHHLLIMTIMRGMQCRVVYAVRCHSKFKIGVQIEEKILPSFSSSTFQFQKG